ncbi:MAG: GNAT family N-acetyltransferase [Bacteroidetes bacterium]|nr:GNAT family N-acetyltransferase [Bacteroidota bacterium]
MAPHIRAGQILADAFLHYPLMLHAFEGRTEESRHRGLRQLYTRCASGASLYGGVVINDTNDGALIWLPGDSFPLGLPREIRAGMGLIPFTVGPRATLRLVRHDAVSEGWVREHAGEKMGYIWCLGVAASQRGKGYSRALIDRAIEQMRAQGMDSFWLKTEDPKNVTIYQRQGFELMHTMIVPSSGIQSWMMRRIT